MSSIEALEKRITVLEERDKIRTWRSFNPIRKPADGIHEAGLLVDNLQQCRRCAGVLSDYRGAMQLSSDPPLAGFAVGAFVEVSPGFAGVTDAAPTCGARIVEPDAIRSALRDTEAQLGGVRDESERRFQALTEARKTATPTRKGRS